MCEEELWEGESGIEGGGVRGERERERGRERMCEEELWEGESGIEGGGVRGE